MNHDKLKTSETESGLLLTNLIINSINRFWVLQNTLPCLEVFF